MVVAVGAALSGQIDPPQLLSPQHGANLREGSNLFLLGGSMPVTVSASQRSDQVCISAVKPPAAALCGAGTLTGGVGGFIPSRKRIGQPC